VEQQLQLVSPLFTADQSRK